MWRSGWLIVAIAAAGCSGEDDPPEPTVWPALVIDVEVTDGIRVMAYEAARPDACNQRLYVRPGDCDDTSDGWACEGYIGDWINRVELHSGAFAIATTGWGQWGSTWFGPEEYEGRGELSVVLITTDEQRARIAIPATAPPQPTVGQVSYDGESVHVGWSAPASATALAEVYNGFVSRRCHVAAGASADLIWPPTLHTPEHPPRYSVTSYAPATAVSTPLGDAMIWIGAIAGGTVPIE